MKKITHHYNRVNSWINPSRRDLLKKKRLDKMGSSSLPTILLYKLYSGTRTTVCIHNYIYICIRKPLHIQS